jgi:hypothetical protein
MPDKMREQQVGQDDEKRAHQDPGSGNDDNGVRRENHK